MPNVGTIYIYNSLLYTSHVGPTLAKNNNKDAHYTFVKLQQLHAHESPTLDLI
jgi:hypothetical protein